MNKSDRIHGETDEVLIEKIKDRDEMALTSLHGRYRRFVYSLALKIVGNNFDADEVTQATFLKIWRNSYTYKRSKGTLMSWLAGIARRQAIDQIRSRAYKASITSIDFDLICLMATDDDTSISVADKDDAKLIKESIIKLLPLVDRSIINLAYFKGYSHSQIAQHLQLPLGTVKMKLRHGIQKLRKELNGKLYRESQGYLT